MRVDKFIHVKAMPYNEIMNGRDMEGVLLFHSLNKPLQSLLPVV